MATTTVSPSKTTPEHIQRFERKIHEMKSAFAALPGDGFHEQLIIVIHRPGWTTIAEGQFFEAAVDAIRAQAQHLAQMQQQLMAAAESIGRN